MKRRRFPTKEAAISIGLFLLVGCATDDVYFDPNMDFGSIQTVAVLPFQDFSDDSHAGPGVSCASSTA